jgi:hypothetical protein
MSPRRRQPFLALGGLLTTSALLLFAWVGTAAAEPSENFSGYRSTASGVMTVPLAQSPADFTKVAEYWRPERIEKAESYSPASPARNGSGASAGSASTSSGGTVTKAAAAGSASASKASRQRAVPPHVPARVSTNPGRPLGIGKVFFRVGAKEYWCSAVAVNAKNRSLVATAGHCAFDVRQNRPAESWIFIPDFQKNSSPDIYVGHTLTMHDGLAGGDYDFDFAFIAVHQAFRWQIGKDAAGKPTYSIVRGGRLQDVEGAQGIAVRKGVGLTVSAFGYPAGPHPDGSRPYNGRSLVTCTGSTLRTVAPSYLLNDGVRLDKCAFTAGASGGPWLLRYDAAKGVGYLNGINSLSWNRNLDGKLDSISSPYFGPSLFEVYSRAERIPVG